MMQLATYSNIMRVGGQNPIGLAEDFILAIAPKFQHNNESVASIKT